MDHSTCYVIANSAIAIAKNPIHHDRTTHVEIDRHFINEKIEGKVIAPSYIPTHHQMVNILTKALHRPNFQELCSKQGMINIYNQA